MKRTTINDSISNRPVLKVWAAVGGAVGIICFFSLLNEFVLSHRNSIEIDWAMLLAALTPVLAAWLSPPRGNEGAA